MVKAILKTVMITCLAISATQFAWAQEIQIGPNETWLEVKADGVVYRKPDQATFQAAVVTTGDTARGAVDLNSKKMSKLVKHLQELDGGSIQIQTEKIKVTPVMNEEDRDRYGNTIRTKPPEILGYVASNRLSVTISNIEKTPEILGAMFEGGANEVEGPDLDLKNNAEAIEQARKEAVRKANTEAEAYARAYGFKVSRVLRISERGRYFKMSGNTIVVTGSRRVFVPFEAGEIPVNVTIWVDYMLSPK